MANSYEYTIRLKDLFSGPMAAAARGASALHSAMGKVIPSASSSASSLQKAAQGAEQLSRSQQNASSSSSSLGSSLGSMVARIGGAIAVWEGFKGALNLGSELEQNRVRFQTYLGSVEKGNAMIKDLNEMANATPFSNDEILNAGATLLNFGLSAEDIMPTMQAIGDVSGGNSERFQALSLAFGQVSSSGKLAGQDLMQMINAGFNPLQEISRQTGIEVGALKEAMSQGAISSEMVAQAFKSASAEGGPFYEMMKKQSETLGGKWSTLVGQFQDNIAVLMEQYINPMMGGLIDFATNVMGNFSTVFTFFRDNMDILAILAVGIGALVAQTVWLAAVSKAQAFWTTIMTAKQWLLNIAMNANPIGLIIAGIALLIAGIVLAYKKLDWFREFVDSVWETITGMFDAVASLLGLADEGDVKVNKQGADKGTQEDGASPQDGLFGLLVDGQGTPSQELMAMTKAGIGGSTEAGAALSNDPIWDSLKKSTANSKEKTEKSSEITSNVSAGDKKSNVYNITIQKVLEMGDQIVQGTQQEADTFTDAILDNLTRRMAGTFRSATSG